jgi:hypothetical protein
MQIAVTIRALEITKHAITPVLHALQFQNRKLPQIYRRERIALTGDL